VNEDHLLGDTAQQQRIGSGGIAAANHRDHLVPVEHTVASGTVVDTPAGKLRFSGDIQLLGGSTGGDHHGLAPEDATVGLYGFDFVGQIQSRDLGRMGLGAEFLCVGLHLHSQREAVNAVGETGIIVDLRRFGHLSAGSQLFQYRHGHTCPGGIQRSGITARAAAHDQHIINSFVHRNTFSQMRCRGGIISLPLLGQCSVS